MTVPGARQMLMLGLMLLLPFAAIGVAQDTTGTILGALVDQTGAVLPGVTITIASVDTGLTREVVTNTQGQYVASLPVGNYEISFRLPNFQPFTARGISLHVNDRLQVNAKLSAGAVETLTVTAERLLQPTSAIQHLVPSLAIRELPQLNRTFVQLVTLVPGVSSDLREDACFCDQGNLNISINGARRGAVNWLLDGASNVNSFNNYTLVTTPSLEAIQEINVITSTYSAEWARNGGGVVNAVTRSGTSRFSGSAYHFLRNDGLNANSFFRNMNPRPEVNSQPPRLRYNNFGYTLGGPALPSRRKLFFFFSEEWRRSSRAEVTGVSIVPNPAWLTDPTSPEYVPPEARDPNAAALLALWPAPNVQGTNTYRNTFTNRFDTRQEFLRADYHVSGAWSVAGRYLHDRVDSHGELPTGPDARPNHRYTVGHFGGVEARRAGNHLLNELSYQLSSHRLSRDDFSATRSAAGVRIPELFPENSADLIPRIFVTGVSPLFLNQPSPREYFSHSLSAAFTILQGVHTMKAGGVVTLEQINSNLFPEVTQGSFSFQSGGGFTAFQNFLRGNATGACGNRCSYLETDIDVRNRFRPGRQELFVQDTWRFHPTVTLDLGVRYAFYPPVTDEADLLFNFSPSAYNPADAPAFADPFGEYVVLGTGNLFNGIRVAGQDSPYGRAINPADTNNLQPRIGMAWDPGESGRMLVRAGYGVYFDQSSFAMFAQNVQESLYDPFRTDRYVGNPRLSNPGAGQAIEPFAVATPFVLTTSDRLVAPRWQHWNAGVQRRLYSRGAIDLGYVASRGDRLLRYIDINQPQPADIVWAGTAFTNTVRPFPGYGAIIMRESTARSRSHGVQAGFRHEAGRAGWAAVNYTFSRTSADATYDNSVLDDPQNPLDPGAEFASAQTDRTHIFVASYVYQLPFIGESASGWRKGLLGGWQIAGMTRMESGPAARIQATNCNYGGFCFPATLRPDQIGDPGAGEQTGLFWFNPAAFVLSPAGEYGSAPVAPFRLPGRHQWDFALSKTIGLGGPARLQFRADLINAFNQTQFLDVEIRCGGTTACNIPRTFGQATSTRPPREIQLGVRLDW